MADVRSLVRSSAQVVQITTLVPGDVYKRLAKGDYASSAEKLTFGVVQDVMDDGERAVITALEFEAEYNNVTTKQVILAEGTALHLYPAMPDEVAHHLTELLEKQEAAVRSAQHELEKQQVKLRHVQDTFARRSELTAAATKVIES